MPADHFHSVEPGDGEAIWFLRTLMTVKASGAESGGAFTRLVRESATEVADSRTEAEGSGLVRRRAVQDQWIAELNGGGADLHAVTEDGVGHLA